METDLLIIGGGPAGLNAAYEAASNGVKTVVVDESFSLGGQLRQQTQILDNLPKQFEKQRGTTLAQSLIEKLLPLNVTLLLRHTMIGTYKDGRIGVSNGMKTIPITAKKVIITTGAAEEASVFPGWTLPGVMTIGAAQILMNREYVLPGENALILGSNTFSLEVVKQLIEIGVSVQGIVESDSELNSNDEKAIQLLKEYDIPIYLNSFIVSATGVGEVQKIILNHNGVEEQMDIDLVCIGKGVTPILEPFEIMNCSFTYQTGLGGWVPQYSILMETSKPSIYVAGNAAGIATIGAILLTGEIAAVSVVESLGVLCEEQATERRASLWKELYYLETVNTQETYSARMNLVRGFHEENNLPSSSLFDLSLEGS
ncbi:NAD(P)/FAD-dependent oxidoreductase [Virgibacillus necropolis]|uniref:NAD(P)/FAD-dependent oxidoreductase n=1 Tax=Virgibacillus necropolis TaxID=163877 RepID=UPI00384B5120